MRHYIQPAVAVLLLIASAACSGEDDAAQQRTPPSGAKRVDVSKAGSLSGRVTIAGPVPHNQPINMSGDPACQRANEGGASFETIVSENGGLGNVFVYVKDGLGGYFFDTPSEPVILDQKGCRYTPHVFGVQVGQRVQFVNSDPLPHTVHAVPNANTEFNFSQPIQRQKDVRSFATPEVMVRFKCDLHNWMSAYAGVLEHPYFAVTRPGGEFELKNLPAGTYTIDAWHEKLGTQTQQVTLTENDKKEVTFAFKSSAGTVP